MEYNKLVRDGIPELFMDEGHTVNVKVIKTWDIDEELKKVLHEEVGKLCACSGKDEYIEELSNVLEVLHAIADRQAINYQEIEDARQIKLEEYGGYDRRLFLISSSKVD